MISEIPKRSTELPKGLGFYSSVMEEGLDFDYHKIVGEKLLRSFPQLIYIAIFPEQSRTRIVVFSGQDAQNKGMKAGEIARDIAEALEGSGGGDSRFAQGGVDGTPKSLPDVRAILLNRLSA